MYQRMSGAHLNALVESTLEASACDLSFIDESDHDTDSSGNDGQLQKRGKTSQALAARAHSNSAVRPDCPPQTKPPTLLHATIQIPTPTPITTIPTKAPTHSYTPGRSALHVEGRACPPGAHDRGESGNDGSMASGCGRQSARHVRFASIGLRAPLARLPSEDELAAGSHSVDVQCSEKHLCLLVFAGTFRILKHFESSSV